MSHRTTAKLFKHGGSQALRLPKDFRFPGERVRLTRMGRGVLIEPEEFDVDAWLAKLRENQDESFMADGRNQPEMTRDEPDAFD